MCEKFSQNVPQLFPHIGKNSATEIEIELEKDIEIEYMSSSSSYAEEADLSTVTCGQIPINAESIQQATDFIPRLLHRYWGSTATQYDIEQAFTHLYEKAKLE